MSDVLLSTEETSQNFTLILWTRWKKENSYGIKLIDFLFEAPNNSDLKLVSSVCRAFLLLMEPTYWQLLLILLYAQEYLKQKVEKQFK